jgi:tRNA pseudouridine38-40 synthase
LGYRVKCVVSYDGTNYHGWQRQSNLPSIQATIEDSLQRLNNGVLIMIHGASRTDQGVHALAQVFHFDTDLDIPIERMALAINTYLPSDIFITSAQRVDAAFHARKSVISKTYEYRLRLNNYSPLDRYTKGFIKGEFDLTLMQQELSYLVGTHSFESLTQDADYDSYERTIYEASLAQTEYGLLLTVTGSGFLRHMVRILMGTLLDIGAGKTKSMQELLARKDRTQAGIKVGPEGLYLIKVLYE